MPDLDEIFHARARTLVVSIPPNAQISITYSPDVFTREVAQAYNEQLAVDNDRAASMLLETILVAWDLHYGGEPLLVTAETIVRVGPFLRALIADALIGDLNREQLRWRNGDVRKQRAEAAQAAADEQPPAPAQGQASDVLEEVDTSFWIPSRNRSSTPGQPKGTDR